MDQYERFLPYFTDRYVFRFCELDEGDKIIDFIRTYWKADHAFVRSRALFDWQYRDEAHGRYNFAVACHRATGEFHAIEGFVPTGQFDPSLQTIMLWGALWKAREDVNEPGIGIMVDRYYVHSIPHALSMGVGLSKHAIANHKSQKFGVAKLDQFFMLNRAMDTYRICVPGSAAKPLVYSDAKDRLVTLSESEFRNMNGSCFDKLVPYKTKNYYLNRYFRHPIYHYDFYGIWQGGDIAAVLVTRMCEAAGSRCIRIVDYIGDGTELIGNAALFQALLRERDAEYIDFMEYGFPKDALKAGGFIDRHETDAVIPNYFEPFVKGNCEVTFSFPHEDPSALKYVVKGDADQDRPNLIL